MRPDFKTGLVWKSSLTIRALAVKVYVSTRDQQDRKVIGYWQVNID